MRRKIIRPASRTLATLLAAALLGPGPVFAQNVVSAPVPVPSGSGIAGAATVPTAAPSPISLTAPLSSPAGLTAVPQTGVVVQTLSLPAPAASRLAADGVAQATSVAGLAKAVPATAKPGSRGLALVAQALAGVKEAAAALPGIGRLAAKAEGPDAGASADAQRAQADKAFDVKLGVGTQDFDAEDADPIAFEPWATVPGWQGDGGSGGKGGGRKKKPASEEPLPDPKYKARDISFNGTVLPSVAMRPDRPVEPLLVQAIDAAQRTIRIAAYEFKSREVLKALRRARERGVDVKIVLENEYVFPRKRPDSKYRPHRSLEIQSLLNEGFDVTVTRGAWRYGIQHNKFMVLDGKIAEFGSYNYSWTAEGHHFENANFTDAKRHVKGLEAYWEYLRSLSVPFEEARTKDWPTELPTPPQDTELSVEHNGTRLPAFFFNPNPASEDWVVKAIDSASETVDLSAFTFRSTKIAEALLRAKKRGVKVRVLIDKSQHDSDAVTVYRDWLAYHKIKVRILAGPDPDGPEWAQKNHNKLMVIDGRLVQTGSMNYTKNAVMFNFENGHFTTDATDAAAFQAFFNDLWKNRNGRFAQAPGSEPRLPTDEQLVSELQVEPEPAPPPPVWPDLPSAGELKFNGEVFPRMAARPQQPIQALLKQAIQASQKTIQLALYEFTLPELLDALRDAKKRGVKVTVLMDFSHVYPKGLDHSGKPRQRSPQIQALMDDGFDIRVVKGLRSTGTMHNKFGIFDGSFFAAGSYNWANTAEHNHFENVFFDDDAKRIAYYQRYYEYMLDLAVPAAEGDTTDWKKRKPGPAPVDEDLALELNGQRFPRSAGSPGGQVEQILIRAIQAAKVSVDIAMFSFYSKPIAEALLAAKGRGVKVRLALDEGQAKLMKLDEWFAYHELDVRIVPGPNDDGNVMFEKQHNKFMVVDGKLLETGSFNYTPNAENNNFDNANFFANDPIVAAFQAFFEVMFDWGWEPRKPTKPPMATTDYFEKLAKVASGADGE